MSRLLLADDDDVTLDLMAGMASNWGYEASTVSDSRQVLSQAVSTAPDLILLDVVMPHMDGFQVLRQLRAEPATATVPVIFLTAGRVDGAARMEGLELGAADYLSKPIHPGELRLRIERVLSVQREFVASSARDLQVVRSVATFLNHHFNNALCVIQLSADLIAEQGDDRIGRRAELIIEKVGELRDTLKALRTVRRFVTTDYLANEQMLDLDEAVRIFELASDGKTRN